MTSRYNNGAVRRFIRLAKRIAIPIRTSYPVYRVRSFFGRILLKRFIEKNRSAVVKIDAKVGFGAILNYYLMTELYFSKFPKKIYFESSNPLYSDDGADILSSYFEMPLIPEGTESLNGLAVEWYANFEDFSKFDFLEISNVLSSLDIKNNIVCKKTEIMNGLELFDVSIHFRGTDKVFETGKTDSSSILEEANSIAKSYDRPLNIFLATDDDDFERQFTAQFSDHNIITYKLGAVAEGQPRHFSDLAPSTKALEAMMNILLIGSADHCLRTTSYLSAMSILMNPNMKWKTVNRGTKKDVVFPELQIHAREKLACDLPELAI